MKDRSLGIIGRLLKVAFIGILLVSSIHFGARIAWLFLLSKYNRDDDATIWNYWEYNSEDPIDAVFSHLIGIVLTAIAAVILYFVFWILCYIAFGPDDYVDPCPDNRRCPCPRHREEEENARTARMATMTAATTAAVTTTIIN